MKRITSRTDRTKLKTGLYLLDDRSEITYYRIESEYYFIGDYYLAKEYTVDFDGYIMFTGETIKLTETDLIGMYILDGGI